MSAASIPLHEQLDRIEALREMVPAQEPRARLQSMCERLYGEPVPEAWLDQALATVETSVTAVRPITQDVPAVGDHTRVALKKWSEQRYERPLSRAAWKERKRHLHGVWQKWDNVDDLCLLAFCGGIFGGGFGGLITGLVFNAHWPTVISVVAVGALIMAGGIVCGVRNADLLAKCRRLLGAYKKAKLTEKDWDRYSQSQAAAPLLLEWIESDVPLLRGDVKRLRKLIKQENRQHKQQTLKHRVERLAAPTGRARKV